MNKLSNKMNTSFFFSNASISCLTLLNSHTSRNSCFNFLVLIILLIIKFQRLFARNFHNSISNFLFTNSFLLFDCFSFFNFVFYFNFLLFSICLSLLFNSRESQKSNLKENQESDSKKNQKLNLRKKQKSSPIIKKFNIVEKIKTVLKYMRKFCLSLSNFVVEVVKTKSLYKKKLIRQSKLI